ncbi:M28 family peptidase [Massilia haematophila]|uniref:M28 family peptidase n=1 Tax=Massilia haematophila TaxID=457923 RepID=A0ABV7PL51_9BURK
MIPDPDRPTSATPAGIAAALLFVMLVAWLALRQQDAPRPPPAPLDAPATQFAADRALAHLAVLAQTPRPIASDANRRARGYLVEQLRALGLDPQVQPATVQKNYVDYNANYEAIVGVVHNVLVRLPGTGAGRERRPALLVAVHYDSAPASVGAARGAPAAALLEMLRALRTGPRLANDLIVLFADGERAGSLGMQAFVEQHPWARDVGLALRFDAGGSGGPLVLYNTRGANVAAIDGWRRAAPDVRGSSLMHEIYQLAPGALRIGALDTLDAPLLQFANIGLPLDRDGERDSLARLDGSTVQQTGEAMLRLVRQFGNAALEPRRASPQVVFELPFGAMVHYSGEVVWPLARLTCLLLFGVACLACQRAGLRYGPFLQAAFVVPAIAVALGIGAWQLWLHVPELHRAWNPAAPQFARHALAYLVGVCALAAAGFVLAQRRLQRHAGVTAAALAALVALTLVLLLASWLAPGASYLVAWPLIAALACFAALHARRVAAWSANARLALLLAGSAPAILLVLPALRDSFLVLSPQRMNLPVAMLALLLGVSTVLLALHARRYVARALLLAGLGSLALAGTAEEAAEAANAAPPARANRLVYYKDMPTWDAYWLKPAGPLDAWERRLFANLSRPHYLVSVFGWEKPEQWYAWAPRTGLEFPFIRVLRNGKAPERHADFTLVSKNRAPEIRLALSGARALRATMNGRVLTDKEAKTLKIVVYGMEDALLHFRIDVLGDPIFAVRVEEIVPGLPEHLLPPRPVDAAPLIPLSGTSVSADTLWFY